MLEEAISAFLGSRLFTFRTCGNFLQICLGFYPGVVTCTKGHRGKIPPMRNGVLNFGGQQSAGQDRCSSPVSLQLCLVLLFFFRT